MAVVFERSLFPAEEWRDGYKGAEGPDSHDVDDHPGAGAVGQVVHGAGDAPVPVNQISQFCRGSFRGQILDPRQIPLLQGSYYQIL